MDVSPSVPEPELRLRLLGGCEVQCGVGAVHLETTKTSALFAYLALQSGPQPRQKLMGLFWGDQPEEKARRNLRHSLWNLRKQCNCPGQPAVIQSDQQTIAFNPTANVWLDVRAFEQTLENEAKIINTAECPDDRFALLRQAIDLYRGDLLDGVYVDDAPEFEEWLLMEREQLRTQVLEALQRLVGYYVAWGDYATGLDYGRRLLEIEPWLEEAHRQMMRLLALSGQRSQALAQYESCRRILTEELNAEPSAETQALYESIRASAEELYPGGPAASRRNLPPQTTPFVGRQEELAQLAELLHNPACRLITMTGPGGIGKTRLAVRAAAECSLFRDGIYFVPLVGIGSAEMLVPAVADAIGFTFRGNERLHTQLLEALRGKELLLVMDNFEHLLNAADLVAEILGFDPGVKILVTSRERLNLQDEWLLQIEGLRYPHKYKEAGLASLENYSAVQLFIQGAQRVHLGFILSKEDRASVVRLCQLVDGMPLAIELAANWVRIMSCPEIVARMESGTDLLKTSWRDLPERHRSMRAVFEQSWQLLSEAERTVFKGLTVFRGGFQPQAAEKVAGANLDLLASLVDKSFLRRNPAWRYEIHELLRQYGEEKLSQSEVIQAGNKACHYFAEFLSSRDNDVVSQRSEKALNEIAEEIENLRASWDWAITQRLVDEIGKSMYALSRFFEAHSRFREGEAEFGKAAEALNTLPPEKEQQLVLAKLYLNQGRFCHRLSWYIKATQMLEAGLSIFRQGDNPKYLSASLLELATVQFMHGAFSQAEQLLEEALAGFLKINDRPNVFVAQLNLGYVLCQMGNYANASHLLAQALEGFEGLGTRYYIAFVHYFLGLVEQGLGESEKAIGNFQAALPTFREQDHSWGVSLCLSGLASVAIQNGEYDQSASLAQEGLAHARKIGEAYVSALCLNYLGQCACAKRNFAEARAFHLQGIRTAWEAEQLPPVLDGLIGLAEVDLKTGQSPAAVELLSFAIHHPSTCARERDRAERLLVILESLHPPEQGEAKSLETIVGEILRG